MKLLKPGKRGWILIITSTLTILIMVFTVIYFQQIRKYGQVKEQFAQTQQSLEQVRVADLVTSKDELETELKNVTLQLDIVEDHLCVPVVSSKITKTLFDVAESHHLEVNQMTSSMPIAETLEGVNLFKTTLTARVEGNHNNFVNFVINLNAHFATSIIRSVSMVIPDNMEEGTPAVILEMDIYTTMR